jgi:hypothetical protein
MLDEANPAKGYEIVTNNYWLCFFVRGPDFRG